MSGKAGGKADRDAVPASANPSVDRSESRVLRVEVAQIGFYERNPRQSRNPEYDRIKASIREHGMDQPLLITSRPGDDSYFVRAGGNTRLQILQELYEATGEERYRWADCLFEAWDRESTVLLAHLRENELRGNLTFIDKARGILEYENLVAEELGLRKVPVRKLESLLREQGYSVSRTLLSLMRHAVSVLLPVMPLAMQAGLGKPQVQLLRNLERVSSEIWQRRQLGAQEEFDEIFRGLCQRHDGLDWQLEPLRQALELELATAADVSIQLIRMELELGLCGRELEIPEFVHEEMAAAAEAAVLAVAEAAGAYNDQGMSRQSETVTSGEAAATGKAVDGLAGQESSAKADSLQIAIDVPRASAATGCPCSEEPSISDLSLADLRANAYTLARRLAERQALAPLIEPLPDNGAGYFVCGPPPVERFDQLDEELLTLMSTMWWQLAAFAEMSVAPDRILEEKSADGSALRAVLAGKQNGSTLGFCVDPGQMAVRFWRRLSPEDWQDWVLLAANYRALHQRARLERTPLWITSS